MRRRLTTEKERQLTAEILTRQVRHFTRGVLIGSRGFIDRWFNLLVVLFTILLIGGFALLKYMH